MTDQAKPALIEIDVCSGPTLSRAERLAFRPTPRPATSARKEEPAAPPPAPALSVAAE